MKSNLPERPYTIKEAAALHGLPTWKLQRAVGKGLVPSYTFLNRRADLGGLPSRPFSRGLTIKIPTHPNTLHYAPT